MLSIGVNFCGPPLPRRHPFFVCVLVVSWSSFRGFPAFPTCRGGKIALFVFLKRKQFDHSDTHWTGADNFRSLCFFEGLRYREHFTEAYCERFTFLACASVWRNPSVPKYEVEWLVLYVVKRGSERPLLSKAGRLVHVKHHRFRRMSSIWIPSRSRPTDSFPIPKSTNDMFSNEKHEFPWFSCATHFLIWK